MSATVIFPQSVYRRVREPHQLPNDVRLPALAWALYFAVTGKHTAGELGRQMRVEPAPRDEALGRLVTLGLIEEQTLDAAEYVRALAASGDGEEKTLREFLMSASQPAPLADVPPSGPREVAEMPAPVSRLIPRQGRTPQPAFRFQPLPAPDDVTKENQRMSTSRSLSLRALMNLIEKQAGSREAGQLDIYRVFVRVDTVLLKRSGIETLRFTEDRLVSDPELEQAIVRSVKKTLGLDCPESVWVEVA